MKKGLAVLLSLCLALAACGKEPAPSVPASPENSSAEASPTASEPATTAFAGENVIPGGRDAVGENGVISTDVFSTKPNGEQIGESAMIVIDTETGEYEKIPVEGKPE